MNYIFNIITKVLRIIGKVVLDVVVIAFCLMVLKILVIMLLTLWPALLEGAADMTSAQREALFFIRDIFYFIIFIIFIKRGVAHIFREFRSKQTRVVEEIKNTKKEAKKQGKL